MSKEKIEFIVTDSFAGTKHIADIFAEIIINDCAEKELAFEQRRVIIDKPIIKS